MKTLLLPIIITIFLTGCTASTMLSDQKILANTAGILGTSADDLTISNRNEQMPNTYYKITTTSGSEYACVINGGNFMTMGMVNAPQCTKKGETPKPYNPLK
jgi:hypothetical protein